MTRKHFEALAEALRASRPQVSNTPVRSQWATDVLAIAQRLAQFNSRFNQDRFLDACGFQLRRES